LAGSNLQAALPLPGQGSVKALKIDGVAALTHPVAGTRVNLRRGRIFRPGYELTVGASARVTLALSNGTILFVDSAAAIGFRQLLQAPFDPALGDFDSLPHDPSPSNTLFDLERGMVAGRVKFLNRGSSFEVQTAVGSIFIDNSIFEIW
jgi:hypothetical protein